jgi:hypothetical protein
VDEDTAARTRVSSFWLVRYLLVDEDDSEAD